MKGLDIVISHFLPQGGVEEVRPLGNGLIMIHILLKLRVRATIMCCSG